MDIKPVYRLVLRPLPDPGRLHSDPPGRLPPWAGVPSHVRLRMALKQMLRQHGLECVRVEEVGPEQTSTPEANHA